LETVQNEGGRRITREIEYYNLDLILSIGYRVNSASATKFRQWATKVLRQHIVQGYTINPTRIKKNYNEFLLAVDKVKELLPVNMKQDTGSIVELIKIFASTWLSLDVYDKGTFASGKITKKKIKVSAGELVAAIAELKSDLIKKSEATEIFAQTRSAGAVEGIIGNVLQSFAGQELYPSIEDKAAHLLYFMVKNHPFVDGNKRSGAFAFVWFLQKSSALNQSKLTPTALTDLTLLIAESNPKDKDKLVGLVAMLLRK
jgi:prophage maintenance system killer protein